MTERTRGMELTVKLQVFEGPLDLLLYLLEKNKVNIYDIPIVEITEQYMEYIREMKRQDLEVLSEFLVMAATLIDIKSRMLLPSNPDSEEEEEDPRAELVQQLLEYKMYKCMAYELKDRQMDAGRVMYKKPTIPEEVRAYEPPVDIHELMSDITLSRLHEIFESIMKKQQDKIDPLRSKFGKIEKEEVSLEDKMEDLKKYAAGHRHFSFRGLLTAQSSKVEVIVTFLAILELMKMGTIRISQEHIFDEHGSVFECLLDLDKQMNGLSDAQKDVLEGLYYEKDNKAIGEEMGISDATVRTYKFNLQKMKRRARIFLAMMEQIENEEIIALRKRLEPEQNVENIRKPHFDTQFGANLLHPFFTQYNFK